MSKKEQKRKALSNEQLENASGGAQKYFYFNGKTNVYETLNPFEAFHMKKHKRALKN